MPPAEIWPHKVTRLCSSLMGERQAAASTRFWFSWEFWNLGIRTDGCWNHKQTKPLVWSCTCLQQRPATGAAQHRPLVTWVPLCPFCPFLRQGLSVTGPPTSFSSPSFTSSLLTRLINLISLLLLESNYYSLNLLNIMKFLDSYYFEF